MCTTKVYTPVCGPDGKSTYFSPCFAGCTGYNKTGKSEVSINKMSSTFYLKVSQYNARFTYSQFLK